MSAEENKPKPHVVVGSMGRSRGLTAAILAATSLAVSQRVCLVDSPSLKADKDKPYQKTKYDLEALEKARKKRERKARQLFEKGER